MHEAYTIAESISLPNGGSGTMDEQEFQSIYEITARPILSYLLGITGRRDVADDLLQETYCRFLARRPAAMDAIETRKYLFRIATNLLRDRWRKGEDIPCPETNPEIAEEGLPVDVEAQIDLRVALQALNTRERELLWLAYVEGMNHEEIAAAMGLRPLSVRMLLFRARHKAAGLLRPAKENA